jgi:hypothetical protein
VSEINRLIAEAQGWTLANDLQSVQDFDVPNWWRLRSPTGIFVGQGWLNGSDAEANVWDDAPDYEHDLNAVWELTADFAPNWFVQTVNWGHMGDATKMARLICESWLEWKGIPLPTPPTANSPQS